jgi:hypothetical protein
VRRDYFDVLKQVTIQEKTTLFSRDRLELTVNERLFKFVVQRLFKFAFVDIFACYY